MSTEAARMPFLAHDLSRARVLVVDDEPGMRNFLAKALRNDCAKVDVAGDTRAASEILDTERYDLILLDNVMPRQSGVDWLAEQRAVGLFSDVILMTAYADLDTAIAAIRGGASDFLLKPFRGSQVRNAIAQSLTRAELRRQNALLRHELAAGGDMLRRRNELLGSSSEILRVRALIDRAASSDMPVVINGEVGSGKEIAARMLHSHSARAECPFVWLPCHGLGGEAFAARVFGRLLPPTESGAHEPGMLLDAAGGTLFLDEVEALPAEAQGHLIEVLSFGRYRPQGARRSISHDVRIVCSSTQPLREAVEAGVFREDLFYLLTVVEIEVPPLRVRTGDIVEIAEFFLATLAERMGTACPVLTARARRKLMAYPWPGNVMELRNFLERALIHDSFEIGLESPAGSGTETLANLEKRHILQAIDQAGGNRAEAARRLGIARRTIDRKCAEWHL